MVLVDELWPIDTLFETAHRGYELTAIGMGQLPLKIAARF